MFPFPTKGKMPIAKRESSSFRINHVGENNTFTEGVRGNDLSTNNNPLAASPLGLSILSNGQYILTICDRTYTKWYFTNTHTNEITVVENPRGNGYISPNGYVQVHPFTHKMFSGDLIAIHKHTPSSLDFQLVSSPIRTSNYIPGVLVLDTGRTFGRTANNKRLFYKCIPDNTKLPSFLVPYEITLGFSKSISNKYVLIRFESWNEERPHGLLVEVLGDVTQKDVYTDYQLYCRNLRYSIAQMIRTARERLHAQPNSQIIDTIGSNANYKMSRPFNGWTYGVKPPEGSSVHALDVLTVDDRGHQPARPDVNNTSPHIFTIDPENSTDLDDGFSIHPHPRNGNTVVSVYIANVFVWIETLRLWSNFSNRVSTIYLPDRKIPLLPPILSDTLCSLLESEDRFAMVMEVQLSPSGKILRDTATFSNRQIRVSKNYRYESSELLRDTDYQCLLRMSILADPTIRDSHDLVAFWMIQMNAICGSFLFDKHSGIFRTANVPVTSTPRNTFNEPVNSHIDDSTLTFLRNWKHTNCVYSPYTDIARENYYHSGLDVHTYTHITSPIRRLVDILNQTLFMYTMGLVANISSDAMTFCEKWISEIDCINTDMKSIRKLQSDCELLHLCKTSPDVLENIHTGVVFDKQLCSDLASGVYSYTVYLSDLRIVSRARSTIEYDDYQSLSFRIAFFNDEENIRQKVRLQILV